jgi:hypothetical protein
MRKYRANEAGRRSVMIQSRKSRAERPEMVRAHRAVYRAVHGGKLQRAAICQYRGCVKPARDGHHEDYAKPLEVIWYCQYHHKLIHRKKSAVKYA